MTGGSKIIQAPIFATALLLVLLAYSQSTFSFSVGLSKLHLHFPVNAKAEICLRCNQ